MGKSGNSKYENVIVLAGGNNCSAADANIEAIASEYRALMATAQTLSIKVTISSIPPRLQPKGADERIASLNAALQSLATDIEVPFINHHDLFHLGNGQINGGYYHDDVHLSHKGSEALAKSLGLQCVEGRPSMVSRFPTQTKPRTWVNHIQHRHPGRQQLPAQQYKGDSRRERQGHKMTSQTITQHPEGPPQIDDISDFNHVFGTRSNRKWTIKWNTLQMYQLTIVTRNIVRRVISGAKPVPMVLINTKRRMVPVATPTLAVIIALSQVTTEQHVATGSPYNAGTVVNGVTNQNYAHVTSIIENSPKKGRRTTQPMPQIMTSCVMAHLKMLSLKTALPVATMPAAIGTAAWKYVTTVTSPRDNHNINVNDHNTLSVIKQSLADKSFWEYFSIKKITRGWSLFHAFP